MSTVKIVAVGALAVVAADFVEGTDWYKKQVAEAVAKDPKAGVPMTARLARYAAGAAVVYAGHKFLHT